MIFENLMWPLKKSLTTISNQGNDLVPSLVARITCTRLNLHIAPSDG